MKKIIVIGGGLAGLSCASYLAANNSEVLLLEASPKLGGRAYSFIDKKSGSEIDNGQHIMMGCYEQTIHFLNHIDSYSNIDIQKRLNVTFTDSGKRQYSLESKSDIYPFNLMKAILGYSALSIKERLKVIDLVLDLVCCVDEDLLDMTVAQWLSKEGQSPNTVKSLWEILAIGTMNSDINEASAAVFVDVLKQVFLGGSDASKIVLPKVGLSRLFCEPAKEFISKNKGVINTSERVLSLESDGNRINTVITNLSVHSGIDFVVSAVPLHALLKIEGIHRLLNMETDALKYAPIVSVHLWLKENYFDKKFYGMIDSDIHWMFNHGGYISLVTSAAYDFAALNDDEIIEKSISCLSNNFSVFSRDLVLSYKILKEKRATYVPSPDSINFRKEITSSVSNFILAGDWTELMLPATIESAVLSGKKAASLILDESSSIPFVL